ncbi:MAG: SURF1 family protein [Alphaproteobacteria bacterium]
MPIRLKFWPTVITVPALALLLGLGIWQVERMQGKDALIEEIRIRTAARPIALPSSRRIGLADIVFRPVTVTGQYDFASELFLLDRMRGGKPGLHLITPFIRADDAGIVLVDRGWIPLDRRDPETRASSRAGGDVTITGIVRTPEPHGWLTPANKPAENEWFFIDLPEMSEAAGIWPVSEYYILATAEAPAGESPLSAGSRVSWPVANEWRVTIVNDHLSYAIIIFFLAAGLAIGFAVYHLNLKPDDDD